MSKRKLNFCLFGAGEMATIHASNMAKDGRVKLVAIVDPSEENATKLAHANGAEVVNADEAFEIAGIDAYVISSPPKTHADYLERAIKTPSYIFCEKPIDDNFERALQCYQQVQENASRVQMGFNRRFDPHFAQLKTRMDAGDIGNVEQVVIISRDPEAPEPEGFVKSSGMLKEMTIHDYDLVRWLLNEEPEEIYVMADALINREYKKINQVDTATTLIRMASGKQVTIINSLRAIFGYDQRLEVLGSMGQLQVGNLARSLVVRSGVDGIIGEKPRWSYPQRYAEAYLIEMIDFINNVEGAKPCAPNMYDGIRASQMAEAALRSSASGIAVNLERLD